MAYRPGASRANSPHPVAMARFLIISGITLVICGLAWPVLAQLGLGRLPGDIRIAVVVSACGLA